MAAVASDCTISEAAELLGVSRVTLWRWIRDGKITSERLGHRTVRIQRTELERLLSSHGAHTGRLQRSDINVAGTIDARKIGIGDHIVQFYDSDKTLIDAVGERILEAIRSGNAAIAIATPEHRDGLDARLRVAGLDPDALRSTDQYVVVDADRTMARFMDGSTPDPARFSETIGELISRASGLGREVCAFGEMVALLAIEGNHAGAIQLEELWNDLQSRLAFSLICAYPMDHLGESELTSLVGKICAAHNQVIPAESFSTTAPRDEQLRAIAVLQQQARSLSSEGAKRAAAEEKLRKALAAEQTAREAAEFALKSRDEFLAIAAHELRTPLTSLSLQTQMVVRSLRRGAALNDERLVRTVESLSEQTSRMSALVDRLLDVSGIEAGKLMLERRRADLAELVEQIAARSRLRNPGRLLSVNAEQDLSSDVDALRLEQVLANLIENAVKYSPADGPIDLTAARHGDVIEIALRDYGPGIPPEKRARIFERYYQARGQSAGSGLGLGLYICRRIVELHDGAIRAEFPVDGGTRIVVLLPAASASLAQASLPHSEASRHFARGEYGEASQAQRLT